MSDRIVLCVDDEAILLLALRNRLASALGPGYRCETALSGESALELLAELTAEGGEPAAVVSDWRMPGMRGDDFLRKVRDMLPDARLVLLTGYADREETLTLDAEIGLAAAFQKPCDTVALAKAIRNGSAPRPPDPEG